MTKPTTNYATTERIIKFAVPAAMITLLLETSTGGANTLDYYRIREARLVASSKQPATIKSGFIDVATAANDLARIKSVLKLSTTDLAQVLGVSRTAIYNWKSGSHIKSQNLSKLENLRRAADAFIQARITISPMLLDRKLPGGKTLLEAIAAGGDGTAAANSLINLLSHEAEQRRALDVMLADNVSRASDDSGFGAPAFSEG